jgi:diguanylate cyclase (GGDEF)-like protein
MNWHNLLRFSRAPELNPVAFYDPLTGLLNPRGFLQQLGLLAQCAPAQRVVLMLDIDRFRALRNSLGYKNADELLCAFAARLRSALPSETLIGHVGEDAFAIVRPEVGDEEQVRAQGLALLTLVEKSYEIAGKVITIGVSIGIAAVTPDPADCVRNANIALSRAKEFGPAKVLVYNQAMGEGDEQLLQTQAELRAALEQSHTRMVYQPIINLASGQSEGHEALMRWTSETRGVIAPGDFIPMAERAGIAPMLDKWAFAQVLERLRRTRQRGFINVNVSSCSLLENSWVDESLAQFQSSGLAAGQLRLEITETALLRHEARVHANLIRLSRSGIPVILDDFGTGYSSLSHLRLFPIAGIKIDRSFVAQMMGDGREGRIVSAMTRLALDLGMSITAEGVENQLQHQTLVATGCGFGQGHFYGFPEP